MRVVTDSNGRRYSVAETPSRSFDAYPYRRRTVAEINPAKYSDRDPNSPTNIYRRSTLETAPISRKGGNMSKVVRSVKNVTKGYSSVQVKVRNGIVLSHIRLPAPQLTTFDSHLQRPMGAHRHRHG